MSNSTYKLLRVLYAREPGNVIGSYKYWIQEQDDPSQVSVTYSSQLFESREFIEFDVCGEESAIESLRLAAQQAKVNSFFVSGFS